MSPGATWKVHSAYQRKRKNSSQTDRNDGPRYDHPTAGANPLGKLPHTAGGQTATSECVLTQKI